MSSENGYVGTHERRPGDRSDAREHLLEIQRGRLVAAMTEVAAEQGASNLSVAAIVARSGVSRRTFYEVFMDGQECLLAALEESLECARSYVREVYDPQDAWRVRVRLALHALLSFLEDEPARGRLLVVEALGAGPAALERRAQVLGELIEAIDAGREVAERGSAVTTLTAEGLVGSVLTVVYARLVRGGRPALVELTNPLMSMIALPYLGAAAARKELERPLPERRRRAPRAADGASRLNGLPMRITYRTMRVLRVMAAQPGASNRQIGEAAGMNDQGQVSKLLQRLERLGLAVNAEAGQERGMPNVWQLTQVGKEIERATGQSWEAGG
ncbi:MAG TPA: TetR family transcriptional regulator [Solirubrobacteraceae bacterium]|nr:TetR family transcriptional regulator [Solirubrobacteraceae bacterium]